mmetsp:Transcript_21741/g.50063  ORF Transcript_21741/g.50063 Transcript_21741/m.50063 type:complete len:182 (-) Transcript_21741:73-618(-)|eukprot:CAMPEP_0182566056 /NCGR_PEP_ID=MMETSP1324-20130603/7624_1 /TAXON_ID=236786 /ORGANISM="Florenciella sp., Strain RCC1587" /LENGTH=181 /DNA_ID=CAMNT_0024779809 /DNA_START=45 /DNA_END=590 /DNA_ORIENTATION=-
MGSTSSTPLSAPGATTPACDMGLIAEARQICALYDQPGSTEKQRKNFEAALSDCMARRTGPDAQAAFEARRATPLRVAAGLTDEALAADLRRQAETQICAATKVALEECGRRRTWWWRRRGVDSEHCEAARELHTSCVAQHTSESELQQMKDAADRALHDRYIKQQQGSEMPAYTRLNFAF